MLFGLFQGGFKFLPPSNIHTFVRDIKVLGVPLRSISFTSSFLLVTLDNDVQHIDAFSKLGDMKVAFEILTCCFAQMPYYFLHFPPPTPRFLVPTGLFLFDPHSHIWETFKAKFFGMSGGSIGLLTSFSSHL